MKPAWSVFWTALFMLLFFAVFSLLLGCDRLLWPALHQDRPEVARQVEFVLPAPPAAPSAAGAEVRWGLLFYPDAGKRFLVPVCLPIPYTEGIARATLQYLIPSAGLAGALQENGLAFALPPGVDIRGLSISEAGLARVDFSAAFLQYPPEEERLILGSLLCTLRRFPTIKELEVMVEGAALEKFPGGSSGLLPLGPRCWINLEIANTVDDYRQFTAVMLYFCYRTPRGNTMYVPVTRILTPEQDVPWAAVRELLEGPPSRGGLFTEIPAGTRLLGVAVKDGLAVVNLSREVLSFQGGRTGAENVANQLLLTVGALEGVDQVQILVEGQPASLKDGPDLTAPLPPPYPYNLLPSP